MDNSTVESRNRARAELAAEVRRTTREIESLFERVQQLIARQVKVG